MPRTPKLAFASQDAASIPLFVVGSAGWPDWLTAQPAPVQKWLTTTGFQGNLGQSAVAPDTTGAPLLAVAGYGDAVARQRGRFHLARAAQDLPKGVYHIAGGLPNAALDIEALGWLLSAYRFDRYRCQPQQQARLKAPAGINAARLETLAEGEALTRDLINTPASDMGPAELEAAFLALAARHDAQTRVISGAELLSQNLPMIHAVGRASPRAPRLLDMRWGERGPSLTLVGKGVCFDTGGLNIKPGASMGLMKKDMGGAATVLGLAHMIMSLGLPLRLRVLVPAVENAVGGAAMRPQDILIARNGLSIEINNTDAEGRLVLADALALAGEEKPDMVISMATLTGAARVALGPDIPPFYATDPAVARALEDAATREGDPLWHMPFWAPYETMIEPGIADLDNAPKGGFAGSITAALFLRRFMGEARSYAHFDVYGWQPEAAPARTKGGVGQGARAILAALPNVLGL